MKSNKKYYIYRFLDETNKVLYVGQTINLNGRIRQHFVFQRKDWHDEVQKIEFKEYEYKNEMNIYEIYYINKLKPKYNAMYNYGEPIDFVKDCLKDWVEFSFPLTQNKEKDCKKTDNGQSNLEEYFIFPSKLFCDKNLRSFSAFSIYLAAIFIFYKEKGWITRKEIIEIMGKTASKNVLTKGLNDLIEKKIIIKSTIPKSNGVSGFQYRLNLNTTKAEHEFHVNVKVFELMKDNIINTSDFRMYLYLAREIETKNYKYEDIIRVFGTIKSFSENIRHLEECALIKINKEEIKNSQYKRNIYELT